MNYKVYQGTELKQTVTSKTAVINGLQPNNTYDFSVEPDDDNVQTVGGKTRYTHVAYANSSDSERNMNNWLLSYPATQAATITYKDGVNTIDYKGVPDYEVFNFPVKAKKGQSFTVSFSWTQPDIMSLDGTANGVPVSIADTPLTHGQIGRNVINLGISKTSSKLFTISDTATADQTYVSINLGFLRDGIQWQFKASFQQDFGQDHNNHEYVGWYSDFTATDSNDPSQYVWSPNAKTSVTTRGIRFNIPKTLTVDSTITLRYEEYPLGIVPIGNEPSGMFGGGNKQNLSAKVISTANGSSVVEVGGNVIDVGGRNLLLNTQSFDSNWVWETIGHSFANGFLTLSSTKNDRMYQAIAGEVPIGKTLSLSFNAKISADSNSQLVQVNAGPYDNNKLINITSKDSQLYKIENWQWVSQSVTFSFYVVNEKVDISNLKLEIGDIATPYASFVDGDTFTAQPDGTCALFSEHKALYY